MNRKISDPCKFLNRSVLHWTIEYLVMITKKLSWHPWELVPIKFCLSQDFFCRIYGLKVQFVRFKMVSVLIIAFHTYPRGKKSDLQCCVLVSVDTLIILGLCLHFSSLEITSTLSHNRARTCLALPFFFKTASPLVILSCKRWGVVGGKETAC